MATRFYLGSTAAPGITPAFSASWDLTTSAARLGLITAPGAGNSGQALAGTGSANTNRLWTQFIFSGLSAQTISGTVKGQIQCFETNAGDDYAPQCVLRVVSSDGAIERGVLLDVDNSALSNEFVVSFPLTNAKFPRNYSGGGTAIASLAVSPGDAIVLEIGFRQFSASVATGRRQYDSGAGLAGDLPEDEASTASLRTWFEFSQNISFGGAVATPGGVDFQSKRPRRILMPDGRVVYPQNEDERRRIVADILAKIAEEVRQESEIEAAAARVSPSTEAVPTTADYGPLISRPFNLSKFLARQAAQDDLKSEREFEEFRQRLKRMIQANLAIENALEAKRREIEEDDAEILKWLRSRR